MTIVNESLLGRGQPWTEQPGGCQVNGFRVHVPRDFFDFDGRETDSQVLKSKGKAEKTI